MFTRISKLTLAGMAALCLTIAAPQDADACGLKSIGVDSLSGFSDSKTTTNTGQMAVYGKTRVNRRLALAVKAAGHKVFRTSRSSRAASADVVLTSAALADRAERALRGSNAVLVVVLAPGEAAPDAARYVVRQRDRVYVQVAMLERALERSRQG